MPKIKSSYQIKKELDSADPKARGITLAYIRYIIGLIFGVFIFVILLVANYSGMTPTDDGFVLYLVGIFTPLFSLACDIKVEDVDGSKIANWEGFISAIIGLVLALILIIIGLLAGDWQDIIIASALELVAAILAGAGISWVKNK